MNNAIVQLMLLSKRFCRGLIVIFLTSQPWLAEAEAQDHLIDRQVNIATSRPKLGVNCLFGMNDNFVINL